MVSTLSGPIPPHPYYDKSDPQAYLKLAPARVRPEAEEIVRQGRGTLNLGLGLELEGHKVFSTHTKTKSNSKDFLKENVKRLRETQRNARQKAESDTGQPVKGLWKLSQFDGVESKVKEELEKSNASQRPQSANYLRAHSRTGYRPQSARAASVEPPEDKLTVPKAATARDVHFVRRDTDFVRLNNLAARRPPVMHRSASMSTLDEGKTSSREVDKNYKRGEVPQYLRERRKQWDKEETEKRSNMPDPDMPPGHRLMPDDERRETLDRIKKKQLELTSELSSMPICNDTLRVRKKREELEQKLAKVEEAIKIFSRQKVFVKLES